MNFTKKHEYIVMTAINLLVLIQALVLASVTSFIIVFGFLLVITIISGRNVIFKNVDYTKNDDQILMATGNMLLETGATATFLALLSVLNALLLLFFLPPSFPEQDPFLSSLPGIHLFLFLSLFVFPYFVHRIKGEQLDRVFRELLYLEFKEVIRNHPHNGLPSFLFEIDSVHEQEQGKARREVEKLASYQQETGLDSQLTPEKKDPRVKYSELMEERAEFFKEYFPSIANLFISSTATLNAYYFSEMLKIRLQKDPELIQTFIARNPGV